VSSWTQEQVLGLAPDPASARAGQALAVARAWHQLGTTGEAVWGMCQGSAREPYRTVVDLSGPAFSCTCPSRKVPCKHALGLMLLPAPQPGEPPEWASEWLLARQTRAQQQAARPPTDVAEKQKRTERRESRISSGVEDLDLWLHDLVRAGLAEAAARPWSSFEQISARLDDAQAPGLARFVRELGALPHTAPNWPERMLIDVGQLKLLLEAWRRLDDLEPDLQAEVRGLVGINEPRESVLATPPVHDVWDVVGRRVIDGERMLVQRTWLWGQATRRWALLLDFAVGGQSIEQKVTPGASFEADLCFYSGTVRLRAIVKDQTLRVGPVTSLPAQRIGGMLDSYAASLGRSPWQERLPAALAQVVPRRGHTSEAWWLTDGHGHSVRLAGPMGWHLLALSGGQPIDLFGEWDGFTFWPLAAHAAGRLEALRELIAA
jgi:hypothetical protein